MTKMISILAMRQVTLMSSPLGSCWPHNTFTTQQQESLGIPNDLGNWLTYDLAHSESGLQVFTSTNSRAAMSVHMISGHSFGLQVSPNLAELGGSQGMHGFFLVCLFVFTWKPGPAAVKL